MWHIPEDLNLCVSSLGVVSPYIAVYAYGKYVILFVRGTVSRLFGIPGSCTNLCSIIGAGCSCVFVSACNVGYSGSMSWNFQDCP
jgi:hypothetical protein